MRKKILMLTTVYPSPDLLVTNNTNVCHYFASEWVKLGYDVLVVHNYPIYLKILHFFAKLVGPFLASRFNTLVTTSYSSEDKFWELDGVKIIRIPLFKPLPHFSVPAKVMKRHVEKIVSYCKNQDFIPDAITSHFIYPHVPMVNALKISFPNARTCVVVHKQNWKMLKYLGHNPINEMKKIEVWGFRSKSLMREFKKNTGLTPDSFMCYSGIPTHFLSEKICNVCKPINKFIYVGSLIQRKFPEKVLLGICNSSVKASFLLDYVGDGVNKKIIECIAKEKNCESKVHLHGFVERKCVPRYLEKSNCFIMISKDETFGLVYLEAMSMGLITIASKSEGMEGIIENGKNGFLCEAGNEIELSQIIDEINKMSNERLKDISANARKTALRLTDANVAKMYMDGIIKCD